jgi:dihydroflavonol-4-reductase
MSATTRLVLVTGGTGFVGSHVVRRLLQRGRAVHVLARAGSPRAALAGLPLCWHEADLTDAQALERAVGAAARSARERGVELEVVHSAASISYRRRDRELLRRTNVEGTRALLAACAGAGVARLCHVSSVVALGAVAREDQYLDDDAPLRGHTLGCGYAQTKGAAEELVLAAGRHQDVVVVSPAAVFGPAPQGSNTLYFLRRVARGGFGPLAPPGSLSVVGVEDTAEGIVLALERGERGRRYLLSESSHSLRELLALACRTFGRRPPLGRVPAGPWRALAGAAGLLERVLPLERTTGEALSLFGRHLRFRARRAPEELGWSPRPFREVLAATAEWMRARGLVA